VRFILYSSVSLIPAVVTPQLIEDLVAHARNRNRSLNVTGCLILGAGRFSQWLEGPHQNVAMLMDDIIADTRHTDLLVLTSGSSAVRRFAEWSLGYSGGSVFISQAIGSGENDRGARIISIMEHLAGYNIAG